MKFTIETGALAAALKIAGVAISNRTTLPILGNIKIEAAESQVILSTTDLDIHVIQKVPAKVSHVGSTTAPFSILSQLVNRLQSTETKIEQVKNEIVVRSGEVTATLETLPADEFPPPFALDRASGVKCDADDFIKPFAALAHAISTDSSRYNLMGINLSEAPNGSDFAATDGKRLAIYRGGIALTKDNIIFPDVFIRAILKIQPRGEISAIIADGHATIIAHDIEVGSKLIEGRYPNWKQNIPEKNGKAFSCGRKPLIDALQTCSIFAALQNLPGLTLTGKGKEIEISLPGKAIAMVLGTELAGQPKLSIKVNERYLLDALSVMELENVRIHIKDENSALLIEEGAFQSIIMPMRTSME